MLEYDSAEIIYKVLRMRGYLAQTNTSAIDYYVYKHTYIFRRVMLLYIIKMIAE